MIIEGVLLKGCRICDCSLGKRIARQKCLKLEQDAGGIFATYPSPEFASLEISELISIWWKSTDTGGHVVFFVYNQVAHELEMRLWGRLHSKAPNSGTRLKAVRCTGAWNGMITCHSSWKKRREDGGGGYELPFN